MSRHPKASGEEVDGLQVAELQLELVTNALIRSDLPNSVTTDDLVHATRQDSTLQLLTKGIFPLQKNNYNHKKQTHVLYLEGTAL